MTPRAHRAAPRRRSRPRPGLRLAPRRSAGRRTRIDWDRLGRIALVLVLFVVIALYVNPISGFFDAWSESKAERERLVEAKAENAELQRRFEALQEPFAEEREARELGMVADGERSYVIRGLRR